MSTTALYTSKVWIRLSETSNFTQMKEIELLKVTQTVINPVFQPEVTLPSCSRGGITVNFLYTPNRIVYVLEHGNYDLKTART